MLRHHVPSAYRPVLANRAFRRLILGFAVSYLGDGMSFVAVAWLAIELAPQVTAGLWIGGAVAAYTLPGVIGVLVFGRRLRRAPARRLLLGDSVVRAVFLGAIPLAGLAGLLTPPLYIVLLAVSSLLHAWGSAGKYALLTELLPAQAKSRPQHLAAMLAARSAMLLTASPLGTALGGPLTTALGPRATLGASGLATVALGAVACFLLLARRRNQRVRRVVDLSDDAAHRALDAPTYRRHATSAMTGVPS